MRGHGWAGLLLPLASLTSLCVANQMSYTADFVPRQVSVFQQDRPEDCPPCFNCNLGQFTCQQFANCTQSTGQCSCPAGFGGPDCSSPLCGSPVDEANRPLRGSSQDTCECDEGWEGINCNVCNSNTACNALMPENTGGVCYRQGLVQKVNHQACDVTNAKIIEILNPRKPQVTFSCNAAESSCNFQFWVDQLESFYCELDQCEFSMEVESNRNTTKYGCENLSCRCVPDRILCGQADSINIAEFLENAIKGPASFETISTEGGSPQDGSYFSEEAMDGLIQNVFGDDSIMLSCNAGECLYQTEVPGFTKPVKTINTPLIAGVISGVGIFIVAVVVTIWWLSRRNNSKRYGPVHMQEDDDESAKLLADHRPTAFHFENVSYSLNGRQILSGVQGSVHPGEILAIMGGSGAGKTTFIDILARKRKKGRASGDFLVNGETVSNSDFRSVVGFVDQDDTMLPTLTVHETILDSALLRLPKHMSFAAKEQRVNDVEKQLGITHIRDQLIGSEEGSGRGISGGEKRRVGIACELVTSPSILFLDEPTSGLDAYNAFNVVECLVNLVKTYNRTVIFTIHQPRSNIIALFDRLILLAKGRTVYSGPFSELQSYFDGIGYSCPPGFNIADYVVDLTMHALLEKSAMDTVIEAVRDDGQTRSSSLIGVKSSSSAININADDSVRRPPAKTRLSIRQQQESLLYGRPSVERASYERQSLDRNSIDRLGGADSPRSNKTNDDVLLEDPASASHAWLRLSKQSGTPPPQVLNDEHQLPPDAHATGTDLDFLVSSYASSDVAKRLADEIQELVSSANSANGLSNGAVENGVGNRNLNKIKGHRKVGFIGQFQILSVRVWRNLYRNPMLLLTHYAISIVLAVLLGFLYYGLADDLAGFQNRLGLLFFILALFGFSTLTSLTVFAAERLLFTRERAKGYYYPISYFAAKVIFDVVPLRLIPPVILGIIVYPMTGLVTAWPQFFNFMMFLVLFNFAAAAMCLFIGVVFKNPGVANLIGSLTMLFSLLFAGFLLNHDKIPKFVVWLQNISIFHYAFEGLIVNEVKKLSLTDHKYGLDIEVPGAAIVSSFGFNVNGLKSDAIGLVIFTGVFMCIAYLAMHILLVERR